MATSPSLRLRVFVYGFLALVLATSVLGVEAWPLTGWRLFSQVRTDTVSGWQVVALGSDGGESNLDVSALGRSYRGATWRLADFPAMTVDQREAVCRVWVDGAAVARDEPLAGLRIFRTRRSVRTDFDRPAPPVSRELRYECGSGV